MSTTGDFAAVCAAMAAVKRLADVGFSSDLTGFSDFFISLLSSALLSLVQLTSLEHFEVDRLPRE